MGDKESKRHDKRSKSVDEVMSRFNKDTREIRRTQSDSDIQRIKVNIPMLKEEITRRRKELEHKLNNVIDQKKQLQELKILELKELLRKKIEVTRSDERDILDKFEALIKENMEELDDTARKKISEGGIKSLKLDDKLKIIQDLSSYKVVKNEDIRQVKELQDKIEKEKKDIDEEMIIIANISELTGDYNKQDVENFKKLKDRDIFEDALREMVFPENKENGTNLLENLIDVNKNGKKLLLEAILKRNVTKFNSEEKGLIATTQNLDDKEYRIAAINTLIKIKEEEETFSKEYINHYKKLYEDISESSNDVSKGKAYRSNFETLKLFEDNFKNLKTERIEFESVCESCKIAQKIYVGYSYASGEIRKENFTKLNEIVKVSNNKYIKLLKSIVECGKNQEKDFNEYLVKNKKLILKDIEKGVRNIEKIEKNFRIAGLNDLKNNLKEVRNDVDIESLKKIINSFNGVASAIETLEKKLEDSEDKEKASKLNIKLKSNKLKKIDTMQQRLDYVQTYATEIVDVIRKMINDNKKDIQMELYSKYLSMASEINDDSTKKISNAMVDIIRINEQNVEKHISDNMKVLSNMTKVSLKEKIKGGVRNILKFLKVLRKGKLDIRILSLQGKLKKVQREAQKQEKKKDTSAKHLSKQINK